MNDPTRRRPLRRWILLSISVATLATAGALVALTAAGSTEIMCNGRQRQAIAPLQVPNSMPNHASSTCAAWSTAKRRIDAASALPAGWYWDASRTTADIDELAVAVSYDLDRFDSHIAHNEPADVSDAARTFVSGKRAEVTALTARTFDNSLAAVVADARANLNKACGAPSKGTGAA